MGNLSGCNESYATLGKFETTIIFSDYGEIGQPSIVTTRTIQPGEELTVDYGAHYDYKKNKFQRGRGFVPETWGQVVF
eukprot:COSAG05_NODE_119_length_17779_cov_273.146049_14_plen_78_part_00